MTSTVLISVGLIFAAAFFLMYCENCPQEKIIMQYLVLFFGILLILLGFLAFTETKGEIQHIHYRHRH